MSPPRVACLSENLVYLDVNLCPKLCLPCVESGAEAVPFSLWSAPELLAGGVPRFRPRAPASRAPPPCPHQPRAATLAAPPEPQIRIHPAHPPASLPPPGRSPASDAYALGMALFEIFAQREAFDHLLPAQDDTQSCGQSGQSVQSAVLRFVAEDDARPVFPESARARRRSGAAPACRWREL